MKTIKILLASFFTSVVFSWVVVLPFLGAKWIGWLDDDVYYNIIWPIIAFTIIPIGTISLFLQKKKKQPPKSTENNKETTN